MNVFFDVDDTIISMSDRSLRPMVREVFARLREDGHTIYVWSGAGIRWAEVERHGLGEYVADCFRKPLADHRMSLARLGIAVAPHFVVDDYAEVVDAFRGYRVAPYLRYDPDDREMERVYEAIRLAARPLGT